MAKTFGVITVNGLTTVGTLTSYTEEQSAEVTYSHDAAGLADGENTIVQPSTFSAELEMEGSPSIGTEIDCPGGTFIITKIGKSYKVGEVVTISVEGTEKKST